MPHEQGCPLRRRDAPRPCLPSLYLPNWSYCPECQSMVKDTIVSPSPTCPECGYARERYGTHLANGSAACPADGFIENPSCPKCERPMGLATIALGGKRKTTAWWHCGYCNVRVDA